MTDTKMKVIEQTFIPLADGCRLAARIWLPEEAEQHPVPVIFEYLPYRKHDGTRERDEGHFPYLVSRGYAGIRVDIRGSGESDGLMLDEYTEIELSDGVEIINWLADQPWCDGNVGMIGISWGGFNGLQIAALQPAALKAIVTVCSTDDRYADDIHYMGGCLLNDNLSWASQLQAGMSRSPDPLTLPDTWKSTWLDRLEGMELMAAQWLKHQRRDAFWKHGSVCEDYSDIKIPVMAIGGWFDGYSNAIFRMKENLHVPFKAVVGPWAHRYPHIAFPKPTGDFLGMTADWWDQWLKGDVHQPVLEKNIQAYLMDSAAPKVDYKYRSGEWFAMSDVVDARSSGQVMQLQPGRLVADAEASQREQFLSIRSPLTTGIQGGRWCLGMRLDMEHPADQRPDDAHSLCFDTDVLEEDLMLVGAAVLDMLYQVDQPEAKVVVRLSDVRPDGEVTRISYGVLNLNHRNSHEFPEALEPGATYNSQIQLNEIAYKVPAGHKLRIAVSTAYWPLIWPLAKPVTLSLNVASSQLYLPVPDAGQLNSIEVPEAQPVNPGTCTYLNPTDSSRQFNHDVKTGNVSLVTREYLGKRLFNANGLVVESQVDEVFTCHPEDGTQSTTTTVWEHTMSRDSWHTRTRFETRMHCDTEYFYLQSEIKAYEGSDEVFSKHWEERVPRDYQ